MESGLFDVIIIGGSYAGLSAAMALGRSLRKVLIIDSGMPCNQQAPYAHNFITQDGVKPGVITAISKAQVLNYESVDFYEAHAIDVQKTANGFEVMTSHGKSFSAKKLIFATGIQDILPDIEGFSACWGISVVHCPYCHGYELSRCKTALIANGEQAYHLAALITNLTSELTILTNGNSGIDSVHARKLGKHRVSIVETEIDKIVHENGYVKSILFRDGVAMDYEAVYAIVPFKQHCDIPARLGCEFISSGRIKVNNSCQTTIDGVYACGDNTSASRSIAKAVYAGNLTGAMVNKALLAEDW